MRRGPGPGAGPDAATAEWAQGRTPAGGGSGRSCGLLDRHVDGVDQVTAGPADGDVAEGGRLVERDQRSLVQRQDGKQADHDLDGRRRAAHQLLEAAGAAVLEAA